MGPWHFARESLLAAVDSTACDLPKKSINLVSSFDSAAFGIILSMQNKFLMCCVQGDELQLLAGLASDAAGLLWELAAMHDTGDAAKDMLAKSEQLQVCFLPRAAMEPVFLDLCMMS